MRSRAHVIRLILSQPVEYRGCFFFEHLEKWTSLPTFNTTSIGLYLNTEYGADLWTYLWSKPEEFLGSMSTDERGYWIHLCNKLGYTGSTPLFYHIWKNRQQQKPLPFSEAMKGMAIRLLREAVGQN